ncbi:type 4a pilus biogenesis protein PilO [Candidatus Omnitrophota bacterium]
MDRKKITRRQTKLIVACFIVVAALICFWIFVYGPQSEKLRSVKKDLAFIESQITQIDSIIQGRELSGVVIDLNSQLISLVSFLPANQEEIISNLSNRARKFDIEIKSINPQVKVLLEEEVSGYDIQELPILVNLQCGFKNLGEFLNALRINFPVLVRVKSLNIKGQGEGKPILDINLEILAYLSKAL